MKRETLNALRSWEEPPGRHRDEPTFTLHPIIGRVAHIKVWIEFRRKLFVLERYGAAARKHLGWLVGDEKHFARRCITAAAGALALVMDRGERRPAGAMKASLRADWAEVHTGYDEERTHNASSDLSLDKHRNHLASLRGPCTPLSPTPALLVHTRFLWGLQIMNPVRIRGPAGCSCAHSMQRCRMSSGLPRATTRAGLRKADGGLSDSA